MAAANHRMPHDGDRHDPGLVPLAAGLNEGSIIAAELGTVVIGGLLSSTFLTLVVVPAAYWLVAGLRERMAGAVARA